MADEPHAAFRAVVRGRVQGVGFREYVTGRATVLNVTGIVRNLDDGRSVEVVAEGPRAALDRLIDHLRDGPAMSRVDDIDVDWRAPTREFSGFRVAW